MKVFDRKFAIRMRAAAIGLVMAASATLATAGSSDTQQNPPFLALGDSVAFGFITQDGFAFINPDNFIGYPAYVGAELHLDAVNAACPGETTGSFITGTLPDNGCRGYRSAYPLHVAYTGSQLEFATTFLKTHWNTQLVTIGLGANDFFLLEAACSGDPTCIQAGLPGVINTITLNMDTILRSLRATGFRGVLIVVTYYSLDYTSAFDTAAASSINLALTTAAKTHGAVIADVFSAFQKAASTSFAGGKTCNAGLLNVNPQNTLLCDVHPAQSGHQLIADVVEAATGRRMP